MTAKYSITPTIATVHMTEMIVTTSFAKSTLCAKSEPCSPNNPNIAFNPFPFPKNVPQNAHLSGVTIFRALL
jgi:hypothetical protein